jgi:hypothetical protein
MKKQNLFLPMSIAVIILMSSSCSKLNPYKMCNNHSDCASYDMCVALHDEHDSTICKYKEPLPSYTNQPIPVSSNQETKKEEKPTVQESPARKEQSAMDKAKEKCLEIGFKAKTEKFGMCVLEITAREEKEVREKEKAATELRQAEYDRIESESKARELRELQRRSIQAQEQAAMAQEQSAKEQEIANSINLMTNGIQMMNGTGAYAKPQPTIVTPIFIPQYR